jgi:hypothetical protein
VAAMPSELRPKFEGGCLLKTRRESRAASLQFVRKISGFNKPSKGNESSFMAAVGEIAGISTRLLRSLETNAPSTNLKKSRRKRKLARQKDSVLKRCASNRGESKGPLELGGLARKTAEPKGKRTCSLKIYFGVSVSKSAPILGSIRRQKLAAGPTVRIHSSPP